MKKNRYTIFFRKDGEVLVKGSGREIFSEELRNGSKIIEVSRYSLKEGYGYAYITSEWYRVKVFYGSHNLSLGVYDFGNCNEDNIKDRVLSILEENIAFLEIPTIQNLTEELNLEIEL